MPSLESYAAPDLPIADQLRRVPVFQALPSDRGDCLALLREGALFEVPVGVEIVSPGDRPSLHVVTSGGLSDGDGARIWPAGSCLGVAETLAEQPFATTITTIAPTLLYRLDGKLLGNLLTVCPATARRLLADTARATPAAATGEELSLALNK